jgi:triacylglycerol lipase
MNVGQLGLMAATNPNSLQTRRVSVPETAPDVAVADSVQIGPTQATEAVVSNEPPRFSSKRWDFIERLVDNDPHFVQRNFHPSQKIKDPELIKAFGSDAPHSGTVLLHYAGDPPPGVKRKDEPVLLVHGAIKDANFWWDPSEDGKDKGLAQHLRDEGYQVYALTFAHNQDDNLLQAEQISNCIDRIKTLTHKSQVDLVAHSKGGASTRVYLTDGVKEPWMAKYKDDVHRVAFVGSPNGGIDYSFRHSSGNLALANPSLETLLNAPMSWDGIKIFGAVPVSTEERGFGAEGPDYWPGQRQLLARMDKYPLGMFEPDWYTTYEGGEGFVSHSKGIDHYIEEGGNLIERLNQNKIDPDVQVGLLAGDSPTLPNFSNENTGPSDGLLFVDSALKMPSTQNVIAKSVIHQHHKGLISSDEGQAWITRFLSKP